MHWAYKNSFLQSDRQHLVREYTRVLILRQYNTQSIHRKKAVYSWNSFHSNNACAEFKHTVAQFTSSAAATQRASALCGFSSLCQPVCCCLGAVQSLGDAGVKPPDTQRRSAGGKPHHCFHNYLHIKRFTWGGQVSVSDGYSALTVSARCSILVNTHKHTFPVCESSAYSPPVLQIHRLMTLQLPHFRFTVQ